ncbi:MAG TPA: hypothetical protein VNV18_18350 [Stellaceae bacterium]|jgi:hypothetical protein|nr:hypothetical protein [Stellaceae bacterium]
MRQAVKATGIVAHVLAALWATGAAAADTSMGLPEVTVTAPPITPQYKKWSPYLGNMRVEEKKWPAIPCASSRIASAAPGTCQTGPQMSPAALGTSQGASSVQISNCTIAHDLVMTATADLKIEADVMTFDPDYVSGIGFQHRACYVEAGYSDLREDFPDMNQMTRSGLSWRDFRESGDVSIMDFSQGPADCRAFEKRGPRWSGGYVWVIHASFCRADGHPVDPADLDRVLGLLQVRQYESRGNLRPAPR